MCKHYLEIVCRWWLGFVQLFSASNLASNGNLATSDPEQKQGANSTVLFECKHKNDLAIDGWVDFFVLYNA